MLAAEPGRPLRIRTLTNGKARRLIFGSRLPFAMAADIAADYLFLSSE